MIEKLSSESVFARIPPRAPDSHKGTFGSVLVAAGSAWYRGAASLAVEGALRTGAGIVTLASVEPVLAAVAARLPECCLCPCMEGAQGGIYPRSRPDIVRWAPALAIRPSRPPAPPRPGSWWKSFCPALWAM